MSIERIRNYIIENAQKEAKQIIKIAEMQFHEEVEDAKRTLEKQYKELLRTEDDRLREGLKRALVSLRSDYKMRLLEMKNRVIDDVLMRAIDHIQSLPDEDYLTLMGRWLANIPDHLEGQVFVNARDLKRITDAFIDNINKDRKIRVNLNKTAIEIKGGFILKTRHYEIDYTLDTIVRNLRNTLTPMLSDILRLPDAEL